MNITRLHQISQKLDPVINFYADDEDDQRRHHGLRNTVVGAGAVGAAGAGGLYAAGRGVPLSAADAAKASSGAYKGVAGGVRSTVDTMRAGAGRIGGYAKTLGSTAKEGGGALAQLLAKLKGIRFSSKMDRLVHLNGVLGKEIEFYGGWNARPVAAAADQSGNVRDIAYRHEKEKGLGAHLKRNAFTYAAPTALVGTSLALGIRKGMRSGLNAAQAFKKDILPHALPLAVGGVGTGLLAGAVADQGRSRTAMNRAIISRAQLDKNRIEEQLRKHKNGMVPGDAAGQSAML